MPGIMCPAFIFLPDKNNTTSIETPCCFIQRKTPVRICPLPKAGFSNGFSGGKKLVACFLKLVARISKSEPLIFSLLPCGVNTLKICFHFLALRNAVFPFRFSVARCLPSLPGPRGCAGAFCGPPAAGRSTKMLIFVSARLSPHVLCKNALTYFVLRTPFAIFATRQKVLPPKSYDK